GEKDVHFDMEEFAGCRVNNPLSEGKQTAVYTAYDREKGETVALKVIPGESPATEKDKARFLRGAECASQFEHSNMAEVYRFGEEEGVPFICLEFIEGAQLEREIQRAGEPMDLEAAFVVAQQVLETIQSVHDQGFLLRSVRPDNLILTLDMQIVMVDFDLVKPLEDAGEEITGITDFGPVGDPRYAAPELLSRPFLADQRTDVFGAGLTLYYILTGTLPFSKRGKDWVPHMAFRRAAIPFRKSGIQIPDPVWNVVDKSLSNYLDNRYATAEEMLVELQRVMEE
ncbi:MAG: serine/threonine protein kinase, partial [Planctomycetes bacterium]|nr:serine/threonine protein kinase [Planctomycetota bacterium]